MTSNQGDGDRPQFTALPGPEFLKGLRTVHHHVWAEDSGLVGVEFGFLEGAVLAQIVLETDEVAVSFVKASSPARAVDLAATDVVTRLNVTDAPNYQPLIGSDSTWRWVLVNQQGYQDAFQIEMEPTHVSESVTLQYLVIAGLLKMRLLADVKSPRQMRADD